MNGGAQPISNFVRGRILLLLMALCFISHFNRLAMPVAGTERIIPELGIAPEKMGLVYTSFLACYTAGMILGGWGIDRWGPRAMLLAMGAGTALFGALTGLLGIVMGANLVAGLIVVRGLMGLFTTPLHPACARAVSQWMPERFVSSANGLVTFAAVLGMSAAAPGFGALIDRYGWPSAFLVSAQALFVVTVLWHIFGKREAPGRASAASGGSTPALAAPLWSRSLVLLALSYAAVGYFQYLFFYWSEYYFKEVMHLSTAQSRANTTQLILALGCGMPVGGWLADRVQRHLPGRLGWALTPGVAMVVSAVLLLVGVAAPGPGWLVPLLTVAMFCLGASESSFWQAAVLLGGARGGTAAAIINTGGNGIGLLAPLLTPFISARFGWEWGIAMGGFIGLLGALCWLGIDPAPARAAGTAKTA